VFIKAAEQCGIPANEDYNGERQSGASLVQVSQEDGWRDPASRAYLLPTWRRDNLRIVTGALAQQLTFEGRQCTGVRFSTGDQTRTARARREVIVACGAIQSPKLLMLSGIGPAGSLQSMGIPVLHHLPGVGANLQEHPDVMMSAHVNVETYNLIALSKLKMAAAVAQWAATGRGPATSPYIQAVAFTNPARPGERPDIEIMFAPFSFASATSRGEAYARGGVNLIVSLCRPTARGRVSLHSLDPLALPKIELGLLAESDLPTLVAGCRLARRILQTDAFKPYIVTERMPGSDVQTDDEWVDFLRRATFAGNHLVGTCRMGTDEMAVVSPTLQVHGIGKLRVIDASVMPRVTSAHTNAAAFVIGEKGAELLKSPVAAT
jgi:choline dehydrogenase